MVTGRSRSVSQLVAKMTATVRVARYTDNCITTGMVRRLDPLKGVEV